MALYLLRRRSSRRPTEPLEIGAIDRDVFSCPVCSRPLHVGTSRCFGCGSRLVLGVSSQKAALLLAIGTALGLVSGITAGLAFASITAPNSNQQIAPVAVVLIASATTSPVGSTPQPTLAAPAVSALARSSIAAAAEIDNRLAVAAGALHAELHRADPGPKTIAAALRTIASESARGSELAAGVGTWNGAMPVAQELARFYAGIQEIARTGLDASTSNAAAYHDAASSMVQMLASLPAVDAKLRVAAEKAGVTVPPFFWSVPQAPGG